MNPQTVSQDPAVQTRILIVDDNADIRLLLNIVLRQRCTLLEASNGHDALQIIARERPLLVLLDVMMPGEMDGLQVLDAIKGNPELKDTVVAMVTARGQTRDSVDAFRRGADAYFIKPFSPRDIKNWIESRLP
jgi:CheY-like chemotaxis protein